MPAGRPSDYTQELADRICEQLAMGVSVRTVCKADDMPNAASVFRWIRSHPEFCEQYTKAKAESADAFGEDMIDIADDGSNDWYDQQIGELIVKKPDTEHIARSRLRIETRKWLASKLKPKKYGERVEVEHSGSIDWMSDLVIARERASQPEATKPD